MATVTEMRAWLREHTDEDIPARGRLDSRWIAMYEAAHNDPVPGAPDIDWDLAGDDDIPVDGADAEPSVPLEPERPPRTARSARAARRAEPVGARTSRLLGSLRGDQGRAGKGGKGKPRKPPRISLENFTARAWSTLGRIVRPLSPATGNCLQAQAAMAGVLLEDVAQGTIVDRILQGPARAEDKLDKAAALILPPVLVFAIEQNQAAAAAGAKTVQAAAMRHAVLVPVLREALRIGLEVSESYADQIRGRLEREQRYDAQIDELLGLIFGQPQAAPEPDEAPEPEMAGAGV